MNKLLDIKNGICAIAGIIGGGIASSLGGADKLLIALISCIAADYITGLAVAIIFKNSPKTETGSAESNVGFKGLVKKAFILLIIGVVYQVDIVLGANGFIRNAAIIGFMSNECISLLENAGLMGINLPPAVTNAIDILKKKSEEKVTKEEE